eukprot:gnl/TRDRNA2_/TRDRNA2_123263_c1_seq1.p1 gnl/TRDRNA2_/TRDRNA2_123263_c1~~gnl/TRDRNA2_/TRDRNA2_123263_c1_seq1.p1  ORF type:complete len:166 (+),score=29.29 gnl/TRDRNA2_/TRDRNA2_123263_c1_seq1:61-498(+)
MTLVVHIAPLAQATAAIASSAGVASTWPNNLGIIVAIFIGLDVFFGAIIALLIDLNNITQWVVNNKYGEVCSAVESTLGNECIGSIPSVVGLGGAGLIVAMCGSLFIYVFATSNDYQHTQTDQQQTDQQLQLQAQLQQQQCLPIQ